MSSRQKLGLGVALVVFLLVDAYVHGVPWGAGPAEQAPASAAPADSAAAASIAWSLASV